MIDDADVPLLFAVALACLARFAFVVPELVRAAGWGVAIGVVGWGVACLARRLAHLFAGPASTA